MSKTHLFQKQKRAAILLPKTRLLRKEKAPAAVGRHKKKAICLTKNDLMAQKRAY